MSEVFRLDVGGPFHRLREAAHLSGPRRVIGVAIAVTWLPLLVLAALQSALGRDAPMMRDLSVHVRLLVALPLFVIGERVLNSFCGSGVARLFEEGFIAPEQQPRVRALLRRVERWRDSPWPELVLLGAAVLGGVGALVGLLPPSGIMHGVAESRHSMVRAWYALVSLPLFQFLLWRSLFRWGLWVYVLGGLSRTPLRLIATHADRRGGIGFLKHASIGYCALFLLAVSAVLCAGWGTQMALYGARIDAFKPLFYAFVAVGAVLAFAPLLLFVPVLFHAARRGRREIGRLVTDYCRAFEQRWTSPSPPELLGNPDMQALADLSTSYRENVEKMQPLLFGPRDVTLLFIVAQIPAIPILLTQPAARQVFGRIAHLVMGGVPG
jgi:hypothetical protein